MPNTELLLILATPSWALCLLSIYHQKSCWRGLEFHHPQVRQFPGTGVAGEALTALGWAQEELTAPAACSVFTPVHLLHLTAHPVRAVCSPELAAVWLCSTSLLQEALPALLRPTSHCLITQITPFTPKEWDKCPFSALKAPTATFPPW